MSDPIRGFIELTGFATATPILVAVDTIHIVGPPDPESGHDYTFVQWKEGGHASVRESYEEVMRRIRVAVGPHALRVGGALRGEPDLLEDDPDLDYVEP